MAGFREEQLWHVFIELLKRTVNLGSNMRIYGNQLLTTFFFYKQLRSFCFCSCSYFAFGNRKFVSKACILIKICFLARIKGSNNFTFCLELIMTLLKFLFSYTVDLRIVAWFPLLVRNLWRCIPPRPLQNRPLFRDGAIEVLVL